MSISWELDKTIEMLKILLKEQKTEISELRHKLDVNEKEFDSLVYPLEYLGVIKVENKAISLSSQSYSLLFEPLLVHEGTEEFIREILTETTSREEQLSIPAMMVPILLLRSVIPYFGLILKDVEKNGELRLDKQKKDFLFNFFSPFKFDYKESIEKWGKLHFSSDEFYDLWFLLNKWLPVIIQTSSRYDISPIAEKKGGRSKVKKAEQPKKKIIEDMDKAEIEKSAGHQIDERFYNIPLESLKKFFKEEDRKKSKILDTDIDYPETDLTRLMNVNIPVQKVIEYVRQVEQSKGQITLTIYRNGILKWEYFDNKGEVPPLLLASEGIFINDNDRKRFSEHRVKRQSEYLSRLIEKISGGKSLAEQ